MVYYLFNNAHSTTQEVNMKAVCPECGEIVRASQLIFTKLIFGQSTNPSYLVSRHSAVHGRKTSSIVSSVTGRILESFCDGSFRKPKQLVQEH